MKKFVKLGFAVMIAMAFAFVGCKHSTTEPEASCTIITFKANGGVGDDYTQEIPQGSTAKLKVNLFTREDYIFDGWCVSADGDGTLYEDGADFTMTEANEITLYAQWLDNANFIAKQILNMTEDGTIVAHGKLNNESISVIKAALLKCKYYVNLDLSDVRGLTKLEDHAFESCNKLNKIQLPNGIISIGDYAFKDCNLNTVNIPNGVTRIGNHVFENCNISSITIPNTVTTIGEYAFSRLPLKTINIPDSVISVNAGAFERCQKLSTVTIGKGVKTIGNAAFDNCHQLTNITIPSNVESIGIRAFSDCWNLSNVTIENGVKTIGHAAFSSCENLISITIPSSVETIDLWAFKYCINLTNVTIENGVKTIGDSAFSLCENLISITIPGSVNRIGSSAFCYYDYNGEVWSTSLEKITFTDTESIWYRTQWGDFTGGDEIGPMSTDPSINAALFNTSDAFYKKTN